MQMHESILNVDFNFQKDKAIASMLYICQSLGGSWDKYSLLKILYFAEKEHLANYGRPITGDNFTAMEYGPVPSISYNEVQYSKVNPDNFLIKDNVVIAKVQPDLDCLSDSDVLCLEKSINENKHLDFGSLKNKSHDNAYDWTVENIGLNSTIPYMLIAKSAGANQEMLDYIAYISENQSCELHAAD
jgi:uncharacterized phage-associated protein